MEAEDVFVTDVLVVAGLVVETELLVEEVALDVLPVAGPPTLTIALLSGRNQSLARTIFPASFGCTPSPVSSEVENPVHKSTTKTGLAVVEIPVAHCIMVSFGIFGV